MFFSDADYRVSLGLLDEWREKSGFAVWAYYLMPNHVHLVLVPEAENSLRGLGEMHRRCAHSINFREGWRGYLWQERFAPFPFIDSGTDWKASLQENDLELFRRHARAGRPLGDAPFVQGLELICGRALAPGKPGPKGQN